MSGKSLPRESLGRRLAAWAESGLAAVGLAGLHPRRFAQRRLDRVVAGRVVRAGPFSGMKYVHASVGSALLPKLLGTYESELQSIVRQWCLHPRALLIDVGAAEGYYAVGLTHRCPAINCIAFEAEAEGRALLRDMARANAVDRRIDIRGLCTSEMLREALARPEETLLIMDVEGAEKELLDPVSVPALRFCAILVELHPQYHHDIVEEIAQRFSASHRQQLIHEQPRVVGELPFGWLTRILLGRWLVLGGAEYRPQRMSWLWMEPFGVPQSP